MFEKKKKAKILIVEDDALLMDILSKTLIKSNFEVVSVMNGLDVQDIAKKEKPDIILLDLIIPNLDGFGVLKFLKEDPLTNKIPVAILSNLDNVADIKSGMALGAEEFFIKANTKLEKIVKFVSDKVS